MSNLLTDVFADQIQRMVRVSEKTKIQIADESGIPYSTLNRKLKGRGDWTLTEVLLLSRALECPPCALLPEEFLKTGLAVKEAS